VLRQDADANVPRRNADDEGENDRRLITSDTKTRSLNQAPSVRSSLGYYSLCDVPRALLLMASAAMNGRSAAASSSIRRSPASVTRWMECGGNI